jgi:hypothetical protein
MTSENRLLFDLGDILAVRIICGKCQSALSAAPEKWERVPPACTNCGNQWYLNMSAEEQNLTRFKTAIQGLGKLNSDLFTIQLEVASHA